MIEILIAILLGIIFGIITGLAPGIHPNTVVVFLLAISPLLLNFTSPLILAIFIISCATTNTFTDSIPSIYLGAPEESTALSVLPGHRYLLQGKGHEAIMLTIIGSLSSLILGLILIPLLIPFLKLIYPYLKESIPYIILISTLVLIVKEKKSKIFALIIFLMSGILGVITLNFPNLNQPLFPLFTGLFGISTLLISLNSSTEIKEQTISYPKLSKKDIAITTPISVFSGFLVSFLPALGSSQAAIIGTSLMRKITAARFLMLIGGINTINFVLSFISLYLLDKARNGAIVGVSQILGKIDLKIFILFLAVSLITAGLAAISTVYLSKIFSNIITKVNYQKLILSIISIILFLILTISGFYGFMILITGTFIGLLANLKGISKTHLMGSLVLPVLLFYLL